MRFSKLTFQYLFKLNKGRRFLILFLIALPFASMLSFVLSKVSLFSFLLNIESFSTNFFKIFILTIPGKFNIFYGLAVIMVLIFTNSILTTIVCRNLRVGQFTVGNIFKDANENFWSSLGATTLVLTFGLIIKIISTILYMLIMLLKNKIVILVLCSIVTIISYFTFIVCMSAIITILPIMTFSGRKLMPSLSTALWKAQSHMGQHLLALVIPITILTIASLVFEILGIKILLFIANAVFIAFFLVYWVTLAFVSYCDIEKLKRLDNTEINFFKRY